MNPCRREHISQEVLRIEGVRKLPSSRDVAQHAVAVTADYLFEPLTAIRRQCVSASSSRVISIGLVRIGCPPFTRGVQPPGSAGTASPFQPEAPGVSPARRCPRRECPAQVLRCQDSDPANPGMASEDGPGYVLRRVDPRIACQLSIEGWLQGGPKVTVPEERRSGGSSRPHPRLDPLA